MAPLKSERNNAGTDISKIRGMENGTKKGKKEWKKGRKNERCSSS